MPIIFHGTGSGGSAKKLKTARTINGTNFDGTANITTANWGKMCIRDSSMMETALLNMKIIDYVYLNRK